MKQQIAEFDPNAAATGDGIFGLPFTLTDAAQIILPVPWDATVSYRKGTSHGPKAILSASKQVDLYDPDVKDAWKFGIAMDDISGLIGELNGHARGNVESYAQMPEERDRENEILAQINSDCRQMNTWVRNRSRHFLDQGKLVYAIGGDHSVPLGLIEELASRERFGILHLDAHADLRVAYEGFEYSHASIMYNVSKLANVTKIVQVGIRDLCEEEAQLIESSNGRIVMFGDRELQSRFFNGETWHAICQVIVQNLPSHVYVSFDIDGLDPQFCPNTGTPVPGGLQYEQALYLIREIVWSGRTIIGFDLCEVTPGADEWDAIVGARLLHRMANLAAFSNGLQPQASIG